MNEPASEPAIPIADPTAAAEVIRLVDEARVLWQQQRLSESEAPLRQALERAEAGLGPDHPHVSVVLTHLGWLAMARQENEVAVAAYRRALSIRERFFGPDHPDTIQGVEDLAAALFQADAESVDADELALRAIQAHDAAGRDDAGFADLIATVGWRCYWIGRYQKAELMFLRALAMKERLLGPGHASTAETAQMLAVLYDHRPGFSDDPVPLYRKALAGFEVAEGLDGSGSFEARYRLADCLKRRGSSAEAATLFDQLAAQLLESRSLIDPGAVSWMLGEICEHLRESGCETDVEIIEEWAGSYDPFLEMLRQEAARVEASFGPSSPELTEALGHLANACAFRGLVDEAETVMRQVQSILGTRFGPDDPVSIEVANRVALIRQIAESNAGNRPRGPHLGRPVEKPFGGFGTPWADGRRQDLIRAYFEALAEPGEGDPTGAVEAITALTFVAEPEVQWDVILELIAHAPDEAQILQTLAAGPLEGFLGQFGDTMIDRVEIESATNPKFRRVLSGVWKHGMSDAVWDRIRTLQATEPEPLPEMRPILPDGPFERFQGAGD